MEFEFKICSLNCWGIPYVSKDRSLRMNAIADILSKKDYDVVCLQEVWCKKDFFLIRDKVTDILPHSHYFYSGVFGSGICIFSKYPILETFFHQWSLNGYIHKILHGDWYGGKGVGLCKIAFKQFIVNVYSAHLHAEYNRHFDEYEAHRILQAYDTAQFIMLTSEGSDLAVLAGDLNTEPGDLSYRLILHVPGLVDDLADQGLPKTLVASCENVKNSYTASAQVKKNIPGQRIDYVLYHPGSRMQVELKDYCQPLPDRVPGHSFSYSDHEAVESTLVITQKKQSSSSLNAEEKINVLEDCIRVLTKAHSHLKLHKIYYLIFLVVLVVLLLLSFVFNSPFGYPIIFNILRVFLVIAIVFCLVMATIWNRIERNALLSVQLAMEISLRRFSINM